MNLVDDYPADAGKDLAGRARQEQEERLRGCDQDVRWMAPDLPAVAGWRVARADRDADGRLREADPLRLQPDAAQRCLQVALDIDRERLQRRDVENAAPLGLGGHRLRCQPVDAPEEGGERLATAGGRRHQGVLAGGDGPPAALLDIGRSREGAQE